MTNTYTFNCVDIESFPILGDIEISRSNQVKVMVGAKNEREALKRVKKEYKRTNYELLQVVLDE